MSRLKKVLLAGLAFAVMTFSLSGCKRTVSWQQKLTLVIETPAGDVSGSSVTSVTITDSGAMARKIGNAVKIRITGEAVVVEVVPGKYLFALLAGAEHWADPLATADIRDPWPWWRSIASSKETQVLTGDLIPMLVTFDDISKPESVKLVDPLDLAASFGPGVSLKAVTVQVTDEPLTEGRVEEVLGWVTWSETKWHEYACATYGCNDNPIRLSKPDGRYRSLVSTDFIKGGRQ